MGKLTTALRYVMGPRDWNLEQTSDLPGVKIHPSIGAIDVDDYDSNPGPLKKDLPSGFN